MKYVVFKDFEEYVDRVGLLRNSEYFIEMDIEACSFFGSFRPHRADELLGFCRKNPEYHVVSIVSFPIEINRFVPNADLYQLAEGDTDPRIVYCPSGCFDNAA